MCRYFSYFLGVWALGLGTFYAYMLYDVINSVRGLAGPLGAFQSLMGSSSIPGLMPTQTNKPTGDVAPSEELDSSMDAIYQLINKNFEDENKREQYIREFLPDTGLEEIHYKEMNSLLKNFKFEKLSDYLEDLTKYITNNVKNVDVKKKALAKLEEFKANTVDIDESIGRLASHIMNDEL